MARTLPHRDAELLYTIAIRDKVSPEQALSALLNTEYLLVKSTQPLQEDFTKKLLARAIKPTG